MTKKPIQPGNQRALKQNFVADAKALSNDPEVYRFPLVTQLINQTVAFGVRDEAEIFKAAYGDRTGRKYWDTCLSEPTLVYTLAHTLSAHLAENADQLELYRIAIIRTLRDAAETGERWFIGDISPLLAVEDGQRDFANLERIKIHPRDAVEWLLSKPRREHLVPESLRTFLRSINSSPDQTKPRSVTEKSAEVFAADYIERELAAGRRPTQGGLEAAAREAGLRGARDYLRAAFRKRVEVRRGRPTKPNAKIARK